MRNKLSKAFLLLFSLLQIFSFIQPEKTHAADWQCSLVDVPQISPQDKYIPGLKIDTNGFADNAKNPDGTPSTSYHVYMRNSGARLNFAREIYSNNISVDPDHSINVRDNIDRDSGISKGENIGSFGEDVTLTFYVTAGGVSNGALIEKNNLCQVDGDMQITVGAGASGRGTGATNCTISLLNSPKDFKPGTELKIRATFNRDRSQSDLYGDANTKQIVKVYNGTFYREYKEYTSGMLESPEGVSIGALGEGTYGIEIEREIKFLFSAGCSKQIGVGVDGGYIGCISDKDCNQDLPYCLPKTDVKRDKDGNIIETKNYMACQKAENESQFNPCKPDPDNPGSFRCHTAIGDIGTTPQEFTRSLFQLFFALGGVILLFLIIANGFRFMTSQGDPEKVKEAREGITSAIIGIVFVAFAILILQFITIDLLHIPGFNP